MSNCKCGEKDSCKEKCKEPCDDCTCNREGDKPQTDRAIIRNIMKGDAPEHLSYCYSNTRAPSLWIKKAHDDFKKIGKSLKDSKFKDLTRDMNRFSQAYVNNTVLMSQDIACGMFSVFEFAELQEKMLNMLRSYCKNHIMEIVRNETEVIFTFEEAQLLIDCVGGNDFEKSSVILSRKKIYEKDK